MFSLSSLYSNDDYSSALSSKLLNYGPKQFRWSRTLSMAQALCELQLELQNGSSLPSVNEGAITVSGSPKVETKDFIPMTPSTKESRRKHSASGISTKGKFLVKKLKFEEDGNLKEDNVLAMSLNSTLPPIDTDGNACQDCKSCQESEKLSADDSFLGFPNGEKYFANGVVGNFPSPEELANLDESFLAKRCKLGYRASRILKLAQAIIEGRIQLGQLEELSKNAGLLSYDQLAEQLKEIEGFGPFTRANVLVCMGYYHVIPTDSETIRHLKQVFGSYISCFFLLSVKCP